MADLYPRREREDDEISLISMQELAPSPYEDPEDEDFPDEGNSTPTQLAKSFDLSASTTSIASSASGSSARGIAFWLTRTQKYSSYAFTSFLGLHASTVSLAPLLVGLDAGNSSLLLARTYFYQSHPYFESLLIPGTLLLHVGSGLGLRAYRHHQQCQRYGGNPPASISMWRWANFSAVSLTGWFMAPFIAAHAGLLRIVPLVIDGSSSEIRLEYLGHGFTFGKWGKWIGCGFYATMVALASYHVVFGWAKYLKLHPRRRRITIGSALAFAGIWLSGLFVVARSGPVTGYLGRHYDHLYRVFFRTLSMAF